MIDSGRISVDVELSDSAFINGAQSQKVVSLKRRNEYSSGKVAVLTGICDTLRTPIPLANVPFEDAAGNKVTFSSIRRIVFEASPGALFYRGFFALPFGCSRDGEPCVLSEPGDQIFGSGYSISAIQGTSVGVTATYTIILYGT